MSKHNHDHSSHENGHDHSNCNGTEELPSRQDLGVIPAGAVRSTFKVTGMDCADEIAAIQNALKKEDIFRVEANLMASSVQVWHAATLTDEELVKQITFTGVTVTKDESKAGGITTSRVLLVVASGVLTGLGLVLQLLEAPKLWQGTVCLFAVLFGGTLIFPKALVAIKKIRLDMNVLMVVAVAGAFYLGDYVEGATVVFLFSLSETLEAFSVVRARRAIQEVLNLTPKMASLKSAAGDVRSVLVEDLKQDDVVLVRAGDVFPTDGIVVVGRSDVNQAPLTGESAPIAKNVKDEVYGGTINLSGVLEVQITKEFKNSKVSQIIQLVNEAQQSKAPSQKFVDRFAAIYTPAVFVLALGIGLIPPALGFGEWNEWIYKALVLLVIACPCALVISTPVSIVSGLTAMAKRGVLIKGGVFLETLGKIKALAVDKTGTITEGVPQVVSLKVWDNKWSEADVIRIAASIEQQSNHPLAEAVIRYSDLKAVPVIPVAEVQTTPGRGIFATIEGHEYFLGNHRFAHELGVCSAELEAYLSEIEAQALSLVVVGHKPHANCTGEVMGVFGIGDKVRAYAKEAIQELHKAGCKTVVMLSGDNRKTVEVIAQQVGIDEVYGDLLPDGKVEKIKEMVSRYKYVGMVGDGINDAPALAQASIGIAMGAVGTDAAIETADVALMKDDLFQLSRAIVLGRRTLGIIRFNIGFALALKAIFLILALFGYTSMWMAIAADTGATLLVVFNSLRLLKNEE